MISLHLWVILLVQGLAPFFLYALLIYGYCTQQFIYMKDELKFDLGDSKRLDISLDCMKTHHSKYVGNCGHIMFHVVFTFQSPFNFWDIFVHNKNSVLILVICGILKIQVDHILIFSRGDFGRLGHGNSSDLFIPQPIIALQGLRIKQIACGDSHCLAVTMEGEVQRFVVLDQIFICRCSNFPYPFTNYYSCIDRVVLFHRVYM